MRYLFLILLSCNVLAIPAKQLEPTYQAYFKQLQCGEVSREIYTLPNRPGVVIIDGEGNGMEAREAFLRAKEEGVRITIIVPCR